MTIEQLNYLLRKELYAIKNHKDNIDRIKKEYFDSNYGLKEGDKIRILHEAGDEMIGFLKKVEVYLGKRKKRGLFQSSIGKLINADINGSIGIARKVVGDSFIGKIIDSGFVFNPVRINIL